MKKPGPIFAALYVWVAAVIVWTVWDWGYRDNLQRLSKAGEIHVEQAAERLVHQLDRYGVLANLLAADTRMMDALSGAMTPKEAGSYLSDQVLRYGSQRIDLIDRTGKVIASSDRASDEISSGSSPLFRAAMTGRLGREHVLEDGVRQFRYSRGIIQGHAPPHGAVIVSVGIQTLEYEWSVTPESIVFFDDRGVVFASNRRSLLLRQFGESELGDGFARFPVGTQERIDSHEIWSINQNDELPLNAMVITRPAPRIGMTVRGFFDIAPARLAARKQALLAAAGLALLALAALVIAQWRRRVGDRLAMEAAANARLEARVEERTAELQATQHQLVQATKMTALGQMSAGISHELNQPLTAIMNFAENGRKFLDLGRTERASENLGLISQQISRIDRIIRNLRGFARAEHERVEPTDLRLVAIEALALLEPALTEAKVIVHRNLPDFPIMVSGGRVRLQQVVVNLLTNAIDAMDEANQRVITVELSETPETAVLAVSDTGPGIVDPSRIFEPFYTTKDLGASKGLGLGLSISYGIIGSFGGELIAKNQAEGGAVFSVQLPRLKAEVAA